MMTSNIHFNLSVTPQNNSSPIQVEKKLNLGFEIQSLETMPFWRAREKPVSITQNHYEILWIKKGFGRFRIDLQTQQIFANNIVLLFPGQHYMVEPTEELEGYSIRFSQEFLCLTGGETSKLFHSGRHFNETIFPVIELDEHTGTEIELIVMNIIKEYSNSFKSRTEALLSLLKILMIHLSRIFETNRIPSDCGTHKELLKKFMLLLDINFMKMKLVHEYASDLSVSPNYLNEVVKKYTGFPVRYHIQQRIILEAKRLALHSGSNMKEIAYKLGYEDMAHFSKFFKANCGINFTDFRKQLLRCE